MTDETRLERIADLVERLRPAILLDWNARQAARLIGGLEFLLEDGGYLAPPEDEEDPEVKGQ